MTSGDSPADSLEPTPPPVQVEVSPDMSLIVTEFKASEPETNVYRGDATQSD